MKFFCLFVIGFLLLGDQVFAQDRHQKFVDSLAADIEKRYPEPLQFDNYQDYEQFLIYVARLGAFNKAIKNPQEQLYWCDLLKKKFANHNFWLACAYGVEGRVYFEMNDPQYQKSFEKTLFYLEKDAVCQRKYLALRLFAPGIFREKSESELLDYLDKLEKNGEDCTYKTIGILAAKSTYFYTHKDFRKSILCLLDQQKEAEKINDPFLLISIFMQLGNLFYDIGNYEKYIDYAQKHLLLIQDFSKIDLAMTHNNVGAAYKKLAKYDLALLHLDSCIAYAQQHHEKKLAGVWEGIALENKGQILMLEKKYEEAIPCFQKAVPLCENFGEYGAQATALTYLAKCLSENPKTFAQAQFYYDSASRIVKRLLYSPFSALTLHTHLADYYAKKGNYKAAYENHLAYRYIQDSLDSNLNKKETEELQLQYETEKKEQEIKLQKQTIQFQERQNGLVLVGAVALGLFAFYLFRTNRQKQRTNQLLKTQKAEIEKIAQELEQLADFKNTMMGMIVHDFKSPLQRVSFYVEQNYRSDSYLSKSVQTLLKMVNDLLKVQKIEKSDLELELSPVAVETFLKESIADQRMLLQKKRITLQEKIQHATVEIDTSLIRRVLENLFSNAYKYSPEGGKVDFEAKIKDNYLQVSVQDYGQGIAADEISHIFEAYYQGEGKDELGKSLGLGLAFCKMVIEKHGGSIEAVSELGRGTCFRFFLPLLEVPIQQKTAMNLSFEEKEELKNWVEKIEEIPFFEWSLLKEKISQIPAHSEGAEKWKQALETAFFEDNESLFGEILGKAKANL